MRRILIGVALATLLAACSSTPDEQEGAKVEERLPGAQTTQPAKPVEPGTATKPLDTGRVAGDPLKDPANILSKRSVYFDYDSSMVKDEFRPVVSAHAKYLGQNRARRARIEGHTDERGSREYNLALGQRRAEAVKQMMQLLGASPDQIETISLGEEKPKAPGHDEAAWAENRRADIRYQGE